MVTWEDFCSSRFGIRFANAKNKLVFVNGAQEEMPRLTDKLKGFYCVSQYGHTYKMKVFLTR